VKNKEAPVIFVLHENGGTLTKDSLHKLVREYLDDVCHQENTKVIVLNGPSINAASHLLTQIKRRNINRWDLIYIHSMGYSPVLLDDGAKKELPAILGNFQGTSAEAVYSMLSKSDTFMSLLKVS